MTFDYEKFKRSVDYIKEHEGQFVITRTSASYNRLMTFLWDGMNKVYQLVTPSGIVVLFDAYMIRESNNTIDLFRWKEIDGKYHQIMTCVLSIHETEEYAIGNVEVEV